MIGDTTGFRCHRRSRCFLARSRHGDAVDEARGRGNAAVNDRLRAGTHPDGYCFSKVEKSERKCAIARMVFRCSAAAAVALAA